MDYLRGKLRGKTPSWGRGSSPSPSPAPVPLQKCARNDALNYRALFEKEKHEKELFGARLAELENQQKVLQNNLKRFLDLKREMRSFQREAEESDRVVDELIKAVVPDFAPYKRPNDNALHGQEKRSRFRGNRKDDEKENDETWNQQRDRVKMSPWRSNSRRGSSSRQDTECVYRALPVQADPDIPLQVTPDPDDPALPNLSYEWDEAATSHPTTPIGRYNYSVSSRMPSRLDELKLNLQFDVNSKKLPTKLQLEIRDKKGRVVFRKRQNLYYVKVQERLATLDAHDDYIMTVTSITGTKQATEEVKIHNKFHNPTSDLDYTEPLDEMTESMSVPLVTEEDTLTVMETSTCRSPSDASITSGFDEKSIDSIFDLPLRSMESAYDEAVRDMSEVPSCVSPDVPDLEEVVEVSVVSSKDLEKVTPSRSMSRTSGSPRKNPFILMKQPVIPEVLYRWQMGFRKGPCGYRKVPILKVQFKYDTTKNVLPKELDVSLGGETKRVRVGLGACQAELAPTEEAEHLVGVVSTEHLVGVVSRDRTGQPDPSIPKFEIPVRGVADTEINQWYAEQPILTLPASFE